MNITTSRAIPGFSNFWANSDGSITKPNGKTTSGSLRDSNQRHYLCIKYNQYLVSRLIASAWVLNPRPDLFTHCDHINGNTHDNRPENLRWLSNSLNCKNNCGLNCNFYKPNKKWVARCRINGISTHLGYFKTFLEGHRVGRAARTANFNEVYNSLVANTKPQQICIAR